jgi:hypothetical protein
MKFIKCFFVTDMGILHHKWINISNIKEIDLNSNPIKVGDSKGEKEITFDAVYSFKSDNEYPGYIDASKPLEIKEIETIIELKKVEQIIEKRKPGRPPKYTNHARQDDSYL